jgi:hypothetical protein
MTSEAIIQQTPQALTQPMSAIEIRSRVNAIQEVMKAVMKERYALRHHSREPKSRRSTKRVAKSCSPPSESPWNPSSKISQLPTKRGSA